MTLNVLHFIYDDVRNPWVGGGGAVRLLEIYRRLVERLGSVTIVTGRYPGATDEWVAGIHYHRVGADGPYPWSRLTYARAATAMMAEADYDVAVFDFSAYTPLMLPPDRPVGVALGQMAGPTARIRWGRLLGGAVSTWEGRQLRRARHVSAVSHWLLEQARPLLSPGTHSEVVGAGVPDDLFSLERDDRGFVLYYGRFDIFQKGIDLFLRAMAVVADRFPGLQVMLAGRGRDEERLRAMVRESPIRDRVRLVVNVDEEQRAALLSGASLLVMPSRFEGFGMVAAEAMAAGVPLVGTAVDSLPEVVAPPDGGILVPAEDMDALVRAISELWTEPARRAELSRTARESARRFSWDVVADDHLRFLERIRADAPSHSRQPSNP